MLTEFHKANLTRLADYLAALPADYHRFHMGVFFGPAYMDPEGYQVFSDLPLVAAQQDYGAVVGCGTAACAVGHGPMAGVPIEDDHSWYRYCERVFGVSLHGEEGRFMFGVHNEDCPHAAAARIREVLARH